MKEFIEKLIGRLEEYRNFEDHDNLDRQCIDGAIEIVKQLAEEHNGGWIPCSERLPEDGQEVLAYCDNGHCSGISVVEFRKGKTKEELQAMERPCFGSADQWGNNLKPYAWFENGPMQWEGQDVLAWQPLPEPYQPEGE